MADVMQKLIDDKNYVDGVLQQRFLIVVGTGPTGPFVHVASFSFASKHGEKVQGQMNFAGDGRFANHIVRAISLNLLEPDTAEVMQYEVRTQSIRATHPVVTLRIVLLTVACGSAETIT